MDSQVTANMLIWNNRQIDAAPSEIKLFLN